ncbi:hypothetical protein [Rheinheimera tilapiae]|uniref:Transposase n=1 Tax=Rheinheimera tilapiae TaxID=875043 RepID=A0ABV6B8U2_9GAMM
MAQARKKQVSVDATPSYHVVSRCVRRTFLFGCFENKDFSHRRQLIVERLAELAKVFCITVSAFAIMSNHYHLVVRIQKQQALDLDAHEVIRRWNALFRLPVLVERFSNDIPMSSAPPLRSPVRPFARSRLPRSLLTAHSGDSAAGFVGGWRWLQ